MRLLGRAVGGAHRPGVPPPRCSPRAAQERCQGSGLLGPLDWPPRGRRHRLRVRGGLPPHLLPQGHGRRGLRRGHRRRRGRAPQKRLGGEVAVLHKEGAARRGVLVRADAGRRGGLSVGATAGGEATGVHAEHAARAVGGAAVSGECCDDGRSGGEVEGGGPVESSDIKREG